LRVSTASYHARSQRRSALPRSDLVQWPISVAKADDSGDRLLGRTCRDSHVVRGLFVPP
jgi:hypothetical protein